MGFTVSYIKLNRKMLTWGWKDVPEVVALWIHILLRANYTANQWHGEMFEEGTFPTSISKLAEETGLTPKQVRICLEKLQNTGEIQVESNHRYSKIIVAKWSDYQVEDGEPTDKDGAKSGQTQGKDRATLKEIKEIKNKKNIYIRPSLDEVKAYCMERGNSVDPQKWFDYYTANGWKVGKNPMKDWKACVRTWERNTNVRPSQRPNQVDTLPTYSTSNNKSMALDEEEELLRLMGRA